MSGVLDLGFARLDLGREERQGLPEVVYGPGKTVEQLRGIVTGLLDHNTGPVLVTPDVADAVLSSVDGGAFDAEARLLVWRPAPAGDFRVTVAAAGTSDRPVAAEAVAVAGAFGLAVTAVHALGVTDVVSGPLPLGRGRVQAAHGVLPCPAPATPALLTGAAIVGTDLPGETVTPTGAALPRGLGTRYEPVPPMTVRVTGYGTGTRRLADRPT